jgi:hypothetical protein
VFHLCVATLNVILGYVHQKSSAFCAAHNVDKFSIKQLVMPGACHFGGLVGSPACTSRVRVHSQ